MMLYSNNAYDVTYFLVVLKSSSPVPYSYQVVRPQMAELNQGGLLLPVHYRGIPDPVKRVRINNNKHRVQPVNITLRSYHTRYVLNPRNNRFNCRK